MDASKSPMKKAKQKTQIQANISLNKACVTCSDDKQGLYTLFKSACLNYKSSQVVFEKKKHRRRDLIDF
jgi:hypothetical protein